jgi:hypothetical protein
MRKTVRTKRTEIGSRLYADAATILAVFLVLTVTSSFADEIPELEVTAIVGGDKPMAIVNRMMVNEGDIVDGAEVVEITDHYVKFKYNDEIITSVLLGDYSASEDELYELITSDEVKKAIYREEEE